VGAPELSKSELAFLAALHHRSVRYMMVGLGAAALQGAVIVTQDIDLISTYGLKTSPTRIFARP
jgi:hypothetical protein